MKSTITVVFLSLFFANGLHAQMVQDNSKWTFEAKKKSGNHYDLIIHLKLPDKWHIYSFNPGGDGMELAPAFTFDKNESVTLIGKVKEHGKLISERLEGIDGIVNMYKGTVDYVQEATVTGNPTITGTYTYQICNDQMCLPPKKKPFTIQVGAKGTALSATTPAVAGPGFGTNSNMVQDDSKWTFEAKKTTGNQYDLVIHAKIPDKWHIYSLDPGGDNMETPTAITFHKNAAVSYSGKITEKWKPTSEVMAGIDGKVNLYKDSAEFVQKATITGNTTITGTYYYQICTDLLCLRAVKKQFSISINDAGGAINAPASTDSGATKDTSDGVSMTNSAKTVAIDTAANNNAKAIAAKPDEKKAMPLWLLFVIALGAGIAALITPCVYSMIPITVSFFTKRSKTRREGIINAAYYALSIIIIFTLLGVILSIAFGPTALYKLSTNWIANLFFFAMFVVFGISFLGAFEITLPSSWTSKTDAKAGLGSFSGIFFMALTLVIVSFSCTGPIVGPLVVVAGNGGIAGPAVGMFGFSLGLALPFALFAVFPGMLNKIATSGGWLNQVKVTLGFIELAFALKFFSNADLVKHWRLLDREIFIALWIVISVLLGMYLLGKFKLSHDDAPAKNVYGEEYVSIFKLFFAMIAFTFALYLLPGMWGAPLNGLGQFIPPMGTQDFVAGERGSVTASGPIESNDAKPEKYVSEMKIYEPNAVRKLGLVTYFDYDEALAAAKKLKKPIMLDFTGITCVNCRKMESQVWAQPEVIKLLKNDFIVASLFCDATQVDLLKDDQFVSKSTGSRITTLGDKSLDIQINQFKANSQPFYFFIDENGNKLAEEGYGYDPDVQKFVKHLEKVKANYKKEHP